MSEKKLKNAIRRCPYWPSTLFNHTCVCVCVLSRNHPSSCITDPRWICCSWTGRLFWPRTAQRTIYAETINVTHTKHTPVPRVNPDTSQQTTNTNSINATLVIPPSQTAAGVPSTHHPLCPRYVKEKKKNNGKKRERESIYLYFCTEERHGPKTLPVLCLHTNNKQRGEVFISTTMAHTSDLWRAAAQCVHSWVGVPSHCSLRRNSFTAHSLVQVSTVSGAQKIQLYDKRHRS